jgi:CRP/FNR family transcriptional regulator, cyclic AMP receptor protein
MENESGTFAEKFLGVKGAAPCLEVLRTSKLAACDRQAAKWLYNNGRVRPFRKGAQIIRQGNPDDDVYVLLSGVVDIVTNGNVHRQRASGDHIGEMAALDRGLTRSATVVAVGDVVALAIAAGKFRTFLQKFPHAAIEVSKELARRLRQRDEYFRKVNSKPRVFIISASESKKIAGGMAAELGRVGLQVEVWWAGVFKPSEYTLPRLVEKLNECDFAVAVGDPVDHTHSRKKTHLSVRDNVLLEYGMAVSALGLKRAYFLTPSNSKVRVASDMKGLTLIPYVRKSRFHPKQIIPAAIEVLKRVEELGTLQTTKPRNHI